MNIKIVISVAIVLLVCACGYLFYQTQNNATNEKPEIAASDISTIEVDLEKALAQRVMGDPNAPVKVSEHSSLTCGHCGQFHQETFARFKTDYIDTGKVYLVFSDFPLNGPALHASAVARCMPDGEYFSFIQELFEEQDDWAYEANYALYLKTKANAHGMDSATFTSCMNNRALQEGIISGLKASQAQWGINSTPSFVVNNKVLISGALSYDAFKEKLDEAIQNTQ